MKRIVTLLLTFIMCIALLAGCTGKDSSLSISEKSFDTPAKAIEYFVAAIAENNASKALEACNINEYGENFDYAAYTERTGAILPVSVTGAPSGYSMYAEINRYTQASYLGTQIKGFAYSFFTDKGIIDATPLEGTDQIDAFIESVDPAKLKNLTVVRIDTPYPDTMNKEETKALFKEYAAMYGADEQTEVIVLYELDGKHYGGGFTLLRYGKDWKISRLNSVVANQASSGAVTATTEEEYRYLTE